MYETTKGKTIKAITIIMQITIKKPLLIKTKKGDVSPPLLY